MPNPVEQIANLTTNEVEAKTHGKPLVIIYPRHNARSALIAMLLQQYGPHAHYYPLSDADDMLHAWLEHLTGDDHFPAGFGSQVRQALDSKASPEELAAALGGDLDSLASGTLVIFDHLDRLYMTKEADRFFRALPESMPEHVQIVINARLLDLQPWNDLILNEQAAVIGNERAMEDGIYGDEEHKGQLEVFALSGGHVYIDGQPVTSWDGSLPRHLFYYFVDHPMVTRDEIFSVFWPNMAVKEATNVFHVTKRKISERLGYELTNYQSGFYVPSPRLNVLYDAGLFDKAIQNALENEQEAATYWYQAVQLYRSDFLPYISMPWVEARREQLKHRYAQALIGLGRYHRARGEIDEALGYLGRALREKPDWEDVHRDVMMIHYQLGEREQAIAQYDQLTQTLNRMFGIKPTTETHELYNVIAAV